MKIILIPTLLLFSGCAHAVNLDIKGHNLETVYGKIEDGELHVHTMWGNKSQTFITPTSLDTDNGATTKASIPVTVTVTPSK